MAKKITNITVTFNLDKRLECLCITPGQTAKTVRELMEEAGSVRTWYKDEYPTDELGDDIASLSWTELLERMRYCESVYHILEVDDSLVRERVFGRLAYLLGVPYEVIYQLWLYGPELLKES